jgi:hypothetical protein
VVRRCSLSIRAISSEFGIRLIIPKYPNHMRLLPALQLKVECQAPLWRLAL